MKNYSTFVGTDISKSDLDSHIVSLDRERKEESLQVKNSAKGISSLLSHLKKQKVDLDRVLFICENTGIYTNHLTKYLHRLGLDFWVVSPMEIHRSKGVVRGKSDKTDARDIAWFGIRHIDKLKLFEMPTTEVKQLKLLQMQRDKVNKAISMFEGTRENKDFHDKEAFGVIENCNRDILKGLRVQLKKLDKKIQEVIKSDWELKRLYTLTTSVKGIGPVTGACLLVVTRGFTAFENSRQAACYSGTAPFPFQSGSSIRGRTKVNHLANKKVKTLLHMAAMSAVKHDPELRNYYQRKLAEGKNKMLVLNNVRCKLLARVFAVVNRKTPFVELHKYAA